MSAAILCKLIWVQRAQASRWMFWSQAGHRYGKRSSRWHTQVLQPLPHWSEKVDPLKGCAEEMWGVGPLAVVQIWPASLWYEKGEEPHKSAYLRFRRQGWHISDRTQLPAPPTSPGGDKPMHLDEARWTLPNDGLDENRFRRRARLERLE